MTAHEARVLAGALTGPTAPPGHGHLLASLAFGLPLDSIAAALTGARSGTPGRLRLSTGPAGVTLDLTHHLPEPVLIEELRSRAEAETLTLPAPAELLPDDLDTLPAPQKVTEILVALRPRLARPMTPGRIARAKTDWLRRAGADAAVIGFLTGVDPVRRAQMHYTAARRADLLAWHARYLREGLGLAVPDATPGDEGHYGSGIRIDDATLRALFQEQRLRLRALATGPVAPLARIAEAHNAFALYTLLLLYLASGHRPVSHPFELLADIDPETGLLWIADKATGPGSRVAILPPTALAQIAAFQTHLDRLAAALTLPAPDLVARRIRPAADPGPMGRTLFFFLDTQGGLVEMTRQAQLAAVADVFPLQLNWTRHTLRSRLLADGALPPAIDALLGHSHLGEEPFAPVSGLSLGDLRKLARVIEAALQDWDASPCASPLGTG